MPKSAIPTLYPLRKLPNLNVYHPRVSAAAWLLGMLLLAIQGISTLQRDWLETGFLALLPKIEQRPEVADALAHYSQAFNRKLIWLSGAADAETAIAHAKTLARQARDSGLFGKVVLQVDQEHASQSYRQLFNYRYQLLDETTRKLLQTDPRALLEQNQAMLYSPLGQMQAALLEHDPLLLFSRYLQAQKPEHLNLEQGVVVLNDGKTVWALLQTDLANSQLPLDKLERLLQLVEHSTREIQQANGELLVSGLPLFTAYGAASAKQEISTVGVGSGIGILLLFWFTFRSIRPLLLSAIAIGSGLAAALIISIEVFGKIHIITLVFGASLIGVVDDYAQHYLCDGFGEREWNPRAGLAAIFPALLLGLISNLLSYAGLGFSEFPALQEIALFSALGLLAAWLTVVLLFPCLLTGFRFAHEPILLKLAVLWEQRWPDWVRRHRIWLVLALALLLAGGIWKLTPHDDVRLLQSAPSALLQSTERINRLLAVRDSQFLFVSGKDQQEWHHNEQRLLAELDTWVKRDALQSYEGLSRFWPDPESQRNDYRLVKQALFDSGLAERYMSGLAFKPDAIAEAMKTFTDTELNILTFADWLATTDESKRALWLGCTPQRCSSIVALTHIKDDAALASLQQLPGVVWVDQVEELSSLFARSRVRASLLLAAAFSVVLLGLAIKFGWRGALTVMSIPLLSVLSALALTGWLNQLFSLFNLFALLLVLGIGVDYAAFFFLAGERRTSTSLAVTLSALTTLLSFGLLAVSSTEIVHAFGFTVAIGIVTAMLAAPLIGIAQHKRPSRP